MNNYKERMKVPVSKGEYQLFIALKRAGLGDGIITQRKIQLREPDEAHPHGLVTTPDFLYPRRMLALYLDGNNVHRGYRLERDEEIDELMKLKGWTVVRFPYHAPLSDKRKREIVEEVRRIRGRGK